MNLHNIIQSAGDKLLQLLIDGYSQSKAIEMTSQWAKAQGHEISREDLTNIAQAKVEESAIQRVSSVSNQPVSSASSAPSAASASISIRQQIVSTSSADISAMVDEFIEQSSGMFTASELCQWCGLTTREQRNAVSSSLRRRKEKNKIERVGSRSGQWRRIESECAPIDFLSASENPIDIRFPFGLHTLVQMMPGNIAIVAGEPDAGKTAFMLNVVKQNMDHMDVHYFNSEMGPQELRKRLGKFSFPLEAWKFNAWERTTDFHDAILSGEGKLNVIDFLEVSEDFYKVGGMIKAIHDNLDGGIAVIALQKNRGTDLGLGGGRSLEKPRLYLSMEPGKVRIVKGKNWATDRNPNGLEMRFKIVNGCELLPQGQWQYASQQG
ncbi:hypothetical protein OAN24_05190 [Pseudodesulfovibrio sp.]|nr:hypothetical protein [Pseudodesulfovibrio sp.]